MCVCMWVICVCTRQLGRHSSMAILRLWIECMHTTTQTYSQSSAKALTWLHFNGKGDL